MAAALAPLVLVLVSAASTGSLYADNCTTGDALRLFKNAGGGEGPKRAATCREVTLFFDLPSLLLGVAITVSLVIHVVYVRYLRRLPRSLANADLYSFPAPLSDKAKVDLRATLIRSLPWYFRRTCVAVVVVGLGVAFYYLVDVRFQWLFKSIAQTQHLPDDRHSVDVLAGTWWADARHHPVSAVGWCLVGMVGAFHAIIDQATSVRLVQEMRSARVRPSLDLTGLKVLERSDHGMRPLTILEAFKYAGMVVFTSVFVAIVYLCRDTSATGMWNWILALIIFLSLLSSSYSIRSVRRVRYHLRDSLLQARIASAKDARRLAWSRRADSYEARVLSDLRFRSDVAAARWLHGTEDKNVASKVGAAFLALVTVYGGLVAVFPPLLPFL